MEKLWQTAMLARARDSRDLGQETLDRTANRTVAISTAGAIIAAGIIIVPAV